MKKLSHYSLIIGMSALSLLSACEMGGADADMVITDSSHSKGKHHKKHRDSAENFAPLSSEASQESHEKMPNMNSTLNGQNVDISPQNITPDTQVTYGANH